MVVRLIIFMLLFVAGCEETIDIKSEPAKAPFYLYAYRDHAGCFFSFTIKENKIENFKFIPYQSEPRCPLLEKKTRL